MKIIRDRGTKLQNAQKSSQANLCQSISWVPKAREGNVGVGVSVPSLQEMCLKILVKNVDAIASLESVPDALRHRLSQFLCDSRRINNHFFKLLVRGIPTEIRLRDCSWLTEEQFTECFRICATGNLVVLQLDQCGRCLPDYVIVATLARSPRHLSRLTTLSLSGACRLSDGGLRALVSSAPALRSINLSQCSLLTSASIYILAESLRSLLKELYLDDCQGIDAALIVPALIELEHLEVLSVAGIQTVCDEFVKNYIVARGQNMKELVLKDCTNLTDSSIKVIVEHCPGLCVLDLMNLSKLTDLSVGYLTNGCCTLHTLKLCRNPFSDEAVAAFVETTGGSLKELSLNNIKKVGYHTTLSLANHAKNLHSLDLSWCRNLTDNALGLIVDSCLALRLLKLFGCTQVTDAFLNGHSNLQIQIIGLKMSPVLQHLKVPDPHQGALNYSSVSVDMV
ncbi:F-box/LRR-repeat protein 13 [Spatholobus suberectus]|nr:F-box/LRR-repeat protein 13 [Spatholobus suberectus]